MLHVRGGESRQGPSGVGGWRARGGGAQMSHWALVSDDGSCEARHLSDWWGGWGWGEGKCACGWGCTREKEYGCCWRPLAYFFIHAHQYCAHMQIYKHSGINQTRKKEDHYSSLQADCSSMPWPPLKSSFSFPHSSLFYLLFSLSLAAPFHFSEHAPSLLIAGHSPSTLPPSPPHYPVLTKPV